MARQDVKTALMVLLGVVAGALLVQSGLLAPKAMAQSEGRSGGIICVIGTESNTYAPIVVLDTLDQVMMVYRYSYTDYEVKLTAVRTYQWDKRLVEWPEGRPSVQQVRQQVLARQSGR